MRLDHIATLNDHLDGLAAVVDETIAAHAHELTRLHRLRDQIGRARAEITPEGGGDPVDLPAMLARHRAEIGDRLGRAIHAQGEIAATGLDTAGSGHEQAP